MEDERLKEANRLMEEHRQKSRLAGKQKFKNSPLENKEETPLTLGINVGEEIKAGDKMV
jgi:hypothetical protein